MANINVIGAWLSWCSIARLLFDMWHNVHVYEKRWNIWWNCYDEWEDWICVHKYWPHIFHTDDKQVWDFVNRFSEFELYQHRVKSYVDWMFLPVPINKTTKSHIIWDDKLYDKIIKSYTQKQWWFQNDDAKSRLTVRDDYDDRYFKDRYQWIPKKWYTIMMKNMLEWIPVTLNKEYSWVETDSLVIWTWRIDQYHEYCFWKLDYHKTRFVHEKHIGTYQISSQVNYPNDYDFIRITEHKKRYKSTESLPHTIITKEYPREWDIECYPVSNDNNIEMYKMYSELPHNNVIFLWRLAEYKYYDMWKIIKNSMILSESFK